MANRVGIELLPYVCRIVEVRDETGLFGRSRGSTGETRGACFHEIPHPPNGIAGLTAELRKILKGHGAVSRVARVAIWGLKSSHVGLLLPPAATRDLEALARREARAAESGQAAGTRTSTSTSDGIVVGEIREGGRREVGYVSASPEEVQARLQPLRDAGFEIERAVTPALAHSLLVKQRWATAPDQVTAVVAVNTRSTAITVLRGSVVLFSRELPWGSETERAGQVGASFDPGAMAARLASELKRSLVYVKQNRQIDVSHVLVCGDTPDLRALTGPLMHELNVEVETLDGLEGLDVAHLPTPVDQFRAKVAALRPAIGLAAAAVLPVDLQPRSAGVSVKVTRSTQRRLVAAAVLSCALVAVAWGVVKYLQSDIRTRTQNLRQQIARLDPEAQRFDRVNSVIALRQARLAALEAFATQGPRVALVLDALRQAPYDLTMTSLRLASSPYGPWTMVVDGQTRSRTPADAQTSFSLFLRSASSSKYIGLPVVSPEISLRVEDAQPREGAPGAPGAIPTTQVIKVEDYPPSELPRGVDVVKIEKIPMRDDQNRFIGYRTKFTVALPSYWRNRGWAPPELVKAIDEYNRRWDNVAAQNPFAAPGSTSRPSDPPPSPFAGTILDFGLTFEVKK